MSRGRPTGRNIVLTAVAGVVAGVVLFALVVALIGSGKAKSKLGSDTFSPGPARSLAVQADRHPLLFQDLVDGSQDLWVVHVDGDLWKAFQAHAPDKPRRCQVQWEADTRQFRDPCGGAVYPADGAGLTQYPTSIDPKGRLVVDLRRAR